jgi:hypothetical protein
MNIGQHAQHLTTIGKTSNLGSRNIERCDMIKLANALCSQPNLALRENNRNLT